MTVLVLMLLANLKVTWACAGNSYMRSEPIDYAKCDGFVEVGDEAVQVWSHCWRPDGQICSEVDQG